MNVGGPRYTDSQGNLWLADHAYGTGSEKYAYGYVVTDAKGKPKKPSIETTKKPIAGTEDPFLYQSQIADKDFKAYVFDVPNRDGWYEVTLHFAELTEKKPGKRIFSVQVQDGLDPYAAIQDAIGLLSGDTPDVKGALRILRAANLTYYDIVAAVGPLTADVYTVRVKAQNGKVVVHFKPLQGHKEPVLNAIEIRSVKDR